MDMLGTGRKWSSKGGALDTRRVDDILVKLHTDSLDELKKSGLMRYADELEELGDIDIDIDLVESLDGKKLFSQKYELAGYVDEDLTTFTELFDFDSLVLSEQKAVSDFKRLVRLVDPERYDVQIVPADMAVLRKQVQYPKTQERPHGERKRFRRMGRKSVRRDIKIWSLNKLMTQWSSCLQSGLNEWKIHSLWTVLTCTEREREMAQIEKSAVTTPPQRNKRKKVSSGAEDSFWELMRTVASLTGTEHITADLNAMTISCSD